MSNGPSTSPCNGIHGRFFSETSGLGHTALGHRDLVGIWNFLAWQHPLLVNNPFIFFERKEGGQRSIFRCLEPCVWCTLLYSNTQTVENVRLLHSAVPLFPISLPSNRLLSCRDSMWHALAPPQPLSSWLHPMDKQWHLAGAGACPGIAAEWEDSQGTYLRGAESQRERDSLAPRCWWTTHIVALTTFPNGPQPFYTIKVAHFHCFLHVSTYKSVTVKTGEKLSVTLASEIYQKGN